MDFTSALYLGLRHPRRELAAWPALTLGKPAALATTAPAQRLARQLAVLIGGEAAILGTSTLHLFWDVCSILAQTEKVAFLADDGLYPIARWGLERAHAQGAPTTYFRHHDPSALKKHLPRSRRPIVVTDGYCPACGRPAPLEEYLAIVRRFGGGLLIDDTQALGLLGPHGGGTGRASGLAGEDIMQISSLSKGFGAPLAVFTANSGLVQAVRDTGPTQIHCSPPSEASVAAGLNALTINSTHGDRLRAKLAGSVHQFRRLTKRAGVPLASGDFPVQITAGPHAEAVHRELLERGIQTVLLQPRSDSPPSVSFLITADHEEYEIAAAAAALTEIISNPRNRRTSHVQLAF